MRALIREPLVHFVLVAALVFAGHAAWTAYASARDGTITVTEEDMERMAALYASESGALPSPQDMAAMVTDQVRDEALAREARRLGLDVGDTIIERRLAQKMSFMVSDLADTPAPDEATLRKWYEDHPESYTLAPSITFEHIFLNPERARDTPGTDYNPSSSPSTNPHRRTGAPSAIPSCSSAPMAISPYAKPFACSVQTSPGRSFP